MKRHIIPEESDAVQNPQNIPIRQLLNSGKGLKKPGSLSMHMELNCAPSSLKVFLVMEYPGTLNNGRMNMTRIPVKQEPSSNTIFQLVFILSVLSIKCQISFKRSLIHSGDRFVSFGNRWVKNKADCRLLFFFHFYFHPENDSEKIKWPDYKPV